MGKTVGENIKKYRIKREMTQQDLGDQLFLSRQAIAKWENNYSQPSIEQLQKLVNILNISLTELIGEAEHKDSREVERVNTIKYIEKIYPAYEQQENLKNQFNSMNQELDNLCYNLAYTHYETEKKKSLKWKLSIWGSILSPFLIVLFFGYVISTFSGRKFSLVNFEGVYDTFKGFLEFLSVPFLFFVNKNKFFPSLTFFEFLFSLALLFFTLVCPFFAWEFFDKGAEFKMTRDYRRFVEETYSSQTEPLFERINKVRELYQQNRTENQKELSYIPDAYSNISSINYICTVLKNKRAQTLTEAINIYENDLRLSQMQQYAQEAVHFSRLSAELANEAAGAAKQAKEAADEAARNSIPYGF